MPIVIPDLLGNPSFVIPGLTIRHSRLDRESPVIPGLPIRHSRPNRESLTHKKTIRYQKSPTNPSNSK